MSLHMFVGIRIRRIPIFKRKNVTFDIYINISLGFELKDCPSHKINWPINKTDFTVNVFKILNHLIAYNILVGLLLRTL